MERKTIRKFGIKDEVGYVLGDMGGSFVNLFVDAYFLTFCTYVLGISAAWMGTLFLIARLWDAINDPIIGSFPDRWRIGKSGNKFIPYIKIFTVPLALSGVLCFANVPFTGIALHAWVAFVYVMYGMCYTGASMPYGAMASVISSDPTHRAKLSRDRSLGGTIVGMCALSFVPILCFDADNNILPERFFLLSIVFGICSVACYIGTVRLCKERVQQPHAKVKFNYLHVVKQALMNRPLVGCMIATIGSCLYITGNSQLRSYIYKEFYQDAGAMTLVSLASIPVMLICFPLIPRLVKALGKRTLILWSSVYSLVVYGFLLIVPIQNVYVYSIISIFGTLGQTAFTMTVWALVTDCLDYGEWKFRERNDGSTYSIFTFARKIGNTAASALASFALAAVGYVSGVNIVQTAAAVSGIRVLVCAIPVICSVLEIIGIGMIFNLDKKTTETMYSELAERRENEENK